MERLAVFGWDDELSSLLAALERHASLSAVAVGDEGAARLLQARNVTGLPGYRHLLPMARTTEYDTALISTPHLAAEVAETAAEAGADLIIRGDRIDGEALSAAATASVRWGVALTVVRPLMPRHGSLYLSDLIASDAKWQPTMLQLDYQGDRSSMALLRDALSAVTSIWPNQPMQVVASAASVGDGEPNAIAAHLRFADQALATVTVRSAATSAMRCTLSAPAGAAALVADDDETEVTVQPADGPQRVERLLNGASTTDVARLVTEIRGGGIAEGLLVQHEAAVLIACEQALTTGRSQFVNVPSTRSSLRVLQGGGQASSTPRRPTHLALVTV